MHLQHSSQRPVAADTCGGMDHEGEDTPDRVNGTGPDGGKDRGDLEPTGDASGSGTSTRLRCLSGAGATPPDLEADVARLLREFKGLRVQDLVRDSELTRQLPGRVQSALREIDAGDYAAADALLPGEHGVVLAGPGHNRIARRRLRRSVVVVAACAAGYLLIRMLRS